MLDEDNQNFMIKDDALIEKRTQRLICYFGWHENYKVPKGVTSIGDRAFDHCKKLSRITLPEGVTSIGDAAFRNCTGLSRITLPEGVTSIGDRAFYGCTGLSRRTLPGSVISIEAAAVGRTGRIVLDGENQNFMIKDDALIEKRTPRLIHYFGRHENYKVPKGVTSIGNRAFDHCRN